MNPPINWINTNATDKASAILTSYTGAALLAEPIQLYPGDNIPMAFALMQKTYDNTAPYPFKILGTSGVTDFVLEAGTLGQTPDGGSYTLSGSAGGTTAAIAFDAAATTVQTQIQTLTHLGSATVKLDATGVYEIESNDSTVGHATDDLTYNAAALAPNGSKVAIVKTQTADGSLTNRWIYTLVRAFVVYNATWNDLDAPTVSDSDEQPGSDTPPLSSRVKRIKWNPDAIGGAVNLKLTEPGGATGTIGPIPYNADGPTFAGFFAYPNAVGVSVGHTDVQVTKNDSGDYTVTFVDEFANNSVVDLVADSNTLIVPQGFQYPIQVSVAGALALFDGVPSDQLSIQIILTIRVTQSPGQPATVVQTEATLFRTFPLAGGAATGQPAYATISDVELIAPHIFADTTAKNNDVPFEIGQLGFKVDDHTIWYANGTSAGDWQHNGMGAWSWTVGASGEIDGILTIYGGGSGSHSNTISAATITTSRAWVLPDKSGTFAMLSDVSDRPWVLKNTTYTAVAGDAIQADTVGGAFTITLPASATAMDFIEIQDAEGTWGTNNLTIARNGLKVNGGTTNYTANVNGGKLSLVYISSGYGWSIK